MLVLSRKEDECVIIRIPGRTNPIKVVLVEPKDDRARLAFQADLDITIDREEIDQIKNGATDAT